MEVTELLQRVAELEATISTLKIQFWVYVFGYPILKSLYNYFY